MTPFRPRKAQGAQLDGHGTTPTIAAPRFDGCANRFKTPPTDAGLDGATMYEWLPATIVAATFLVGVACDAIETGWWMRLRRH